MRQIADIHELASFLFAAGYRSAYDQKRIPPYQRAIQQAMSVSGSAFVDPQGFVNDKDALRLYLRHRIDLAWLRSEVELLPPLLANEDMNAVCGEWSEIRGGDEPPPNEKNARKRPWWAIWR